ncbi:DNA-3-methyladenine glycosylase family protein [Halapricum hydrolyticum]|uniref:DNA-3-methyladenine glycosylase 2 family protein n=1 Tax=Halapricum hydrolyticum TaxID=2979991 RepID=A0AAE3I9B4_9EURY|nr:DNA-3-methyladenine glycosylase 2 family protein [Halapricum hydrolyticum]MCU4717015.1 DNA-3-methyladenine glycosylase 2 family protein [Halapricum hydrolyticum]MCU4725379.1 DNA-3-methyladenine glycosylase 2 family protein [Halapricum hydrolyticum]
MTPDPNESLRADAKLGPVVDAVGPLRVEPAEDFFARFVVSILRQQVSMASAAATRERLFDAVEVTPEGILNADDEILRDAGLSRQKTRYVNNVARAFREEGYSREYFQGIDDDAVRAELISITGVGTWTADMQLLFSLGRPDVFPVGDLGIRKGMVQLFEDLAVEDRAAMRDRAERWEPYRSYASLCLWRTVEGDDIDD